MNHCYWTGPDEDDELEENCRKYCVESDDRFHCNGTNECVWSLYKCDGIPDCMNGFDEENCEKLRFRIK